MSARGRGSAIAAHSSEHRWEITPGELRELRAALGRIAERQDLDAALSALASWGRALIEASAVVVALRDERAESLTIRAAAGRGSSELIGKSLDVLTDDRGSKRPSLRVPINVEGNEVGIFVARSSRRRLLDERDAELLRLLAAQAAMAIAQHLADREITMLYELEHRRADQLDVAADIARTLSRLPRLGDVLDFTVAVLKSRFGYERVAIYLRDEENGPYVLRAFAGVGESIGASLDLSSASAAAWAARSGEAQLVQGEEQRSDVESRSNQLAVPFGEGRAPTGVLMLEAGAVDAFDSHDLSLVQSIASELGITIENLRLSARAREDAAAAERARLARELHDDTAQQLVAIGRRLDLLRMEDAAGPVADKIEVIQDMIDRALANVRRISRNLRPTILEDLGLVAALEAIAADASRAGGSTVTFEVVGVPRPLPVRIELALYRIAQEALANSLRHAGARRILLSLGFGEKATSLGVTDDGHGFPGASLADLERGGGLGLVGMRERATEIGAQLEVDNLATGGARICVVVPLTT